MIDFPWILPWGDFWAWVIAHPDYIVLAVWLTVGTACTGVAAAISESDDLESWTDGVGKGVVVGLFWPVLLFVAVLLLVVFLLALPAFVLTRLLMPARLLPQGGGKPNH